ncbi:MAG: hypothetical protein K6G50_10630 [bacterium]|nr:hypothetical protein [bacterium]
MASRYTGTIVIIASICLISFLRRQIEARKLVGGTLGALLMLACVMPPVEIAPRQELALRQGFACHAGSSRRALSLASRHCWKARAAPYLVKRAAPAQHCANMATASVHATPTRHIKKRLQGELQAFGLAWRKRGASRWQNWSGYAGAAARLAFLRVLRNAARC